MSIVLLYSSLCVSHTLYLVQVNVDVFLYELGKVYDPVTYETLSKLEGIIS